jgi:integrase
MVQKAMDKQQCTIKDKLEEELQGFARWLDTQINKSLYTKYRIQKPLKDNYKKDILKKARMILKTHIGKLPSQLTKEDIQKWEALCYTKYQHNGNIARFQAMNKLLTYLDHKDWYIKVPTVEEKTYDVLTEEERERYIEATEKRCEGLLTKEISNLTPSEIRCIMDRAIVLIQTMTESRPSEVCNIETRAIDFERHRITLKDSKTHELIIRRGMQDCLLMAPPVEAAIRDWLRIRKSIRAKNPEDEKYLFLYTSGALSGQPIDYNKILLTCKKIGAEAGITAVKTTPYCLKRTEITRDCDRAQNIRIPQIRARHTDYHSTMRYNQKQTSDALAYIQSEQYGNAGLSIEVHLKRLAEKVIKGEITMEIYKQLRADLDVTKIVQKKKSEILGYG